MFSYDEVIALGCLLVLGYPKRYAAAMVVQEMATAVPSGTPFELEDQTYFAFTIKLTDGSLWDVACIKEVMLEDLEYAGDYAVWLDHRGKKIDPTGIPFPNGLIEIVDCGVLMPSTNPQSATKH